mgnify:CR=1 FL=1
MFSIKKVLILSLLLFGFLNGYSQDLVKDYKEFYDQITDLEAYSIAGSFQLFNNGNLESEQKVKIDKFKKNYFLEFGPNEIVYSEKMVLTLNHPFKSIMMSERDSDFDLLNSNDQFKALKEQIDSGFVKYSYIKGDEPYYKIEPTKGAFKSMNLFFKDGFLVKIVSHYNFDGAGFNRSVLKLNYKTDVIFNKKEFSLDRYAYKEKGEYRMKDPYKDYEITLN